MSTMLIHPKLFFQHNYISHVFAAHIYMMYLKERTTFLRMSQGIPHALMACQYLWQRDYRYLVCSDEYLQAPTHNVMFSWNQHVEASSEKKSICEKWGKTCEASPSTVEVNYKMVGICTNKSLMTHIQCSVIPQLLNIKLHWILLEITTHPTISRLRQDDLMQSNKDNMLLHVTME